MPFALPDRKPGAPDAWAYALAVAVSLVVLAIEGLLIDWIGESWSSGVSAFLLIMIVGAIPAAVVGTIGSFVIHALTWRISAQVWHVLIAAAVGFLAGTVIWGGNPTFGLYLGIATGIGRLAVVPRARGLG